ncbi:MAG: hypothetical protein AMJ53_14350, partial [Gammaproteobacteria bacterium SG8_11]
KEVTIVGAKDSEDVVLSLQTPDGETITAVNKPDNFKWFTAQAFDLITIQNPQPGQWQLKSSTGKNKAYIITDLKFQLEVQPQEVAIGEGLMINAWLEDNGKTIAKPSILSTLKMALRVHTPDGDTHELDMQAQTAEDGSGALTGVYVNHIALPADGRYQIEVVADGGTFSRVRNSLVNVIDPNAVPHTQSPAVAETHHEPSPVVPDIAPVIDPALAETAHSPAETHSSPVAESPQPEIPAHDEPVVEAAASEQHSSEPQDTKKHPEQHSTEPKAEQPPQDAAVTQEPAEKTAHENEKAPQDNAAKDGPNIMKALGIFLLINGVFAVLGGLGFLIYNMKKKKAANANAEDDNSDKERDDEKQAA